MAKNLTKLEDLKPAPYNPRRIDDKAAKALGKSIGDFGDLSSIVWNKRTGHVVCGHQRLERLKAQGAELVDGDIVTDSGDRFPVRVVDWPVAKEKAANVTANNQHIAGEFTDGLGGILGDIKLAIGDEDFMGLRLDVLHGSDINPLDGMPELATDDDPLFGPMTFTLSREQQAIVREALARSKDSGGDIDTENKNKAGNCLASLCLEYLRA